MVYNVRALDLMHPKLRGPFEQQLVESAGEAFQRSLTPEFVVDVKNHLRDGILYVVCGEGKVMGFGVMKDFSELNATYISGIVKRRRAHSGIIEKIVENHVGKRFGTVVVRTQNDRVAEIMTEICDVVCPIDREGGERELEILSVMGLGRSSSGIEVGKDMVARRHYGGAPMIGSDYRRRSRKPLVQRATDRLKYLEGDAMLLVGYKRERC